jgi:site-specific recombinase XerD
MKPEAPCRPSISDAVKEWLAEIQIEGKSPRTLKFYDYNISPFVQFAGPSKKVLGIDRGLVEEYLSATSGERAHSQHARFGTLRAFFNWAVRRNYMLETPLVTKAPKLPERAVRIFTKHEFQQMLRCCISGTKLRDRAMLLTFYDSGMTLNEIANLRLGDLDIDGRTITIRSNARKSRRALRVSRQTINAIWDYLKTRRDEYDAVWLTEEKRPMTPSGIQQAIKRVVKRAGIERGKASPNAFRDTFACNFLEAGGDGLDLQYLLGYTSPKMVEEYSTAIEANRQLRRHKKAESARKSLSTVKLTTESL